MFYTTITINDKEYKLKLNARATVDLEKKMGTNPINAIIEVVNKNQIPELNTIIQILHASLQAYEHGISLDDTYDLYDSYVAEGHTLMDIIPVLLEIFKVSGFIPDEKDKKKGKAKN